MLLKVGDKAPAFKLPDADMESIDLAAYQGKKHIVLFSTRKMERRAVPRRPPIFQTMRKTSRLRIASCSASTVKIV